MAEMSRLEKNFPPGLEWRLAFDNVGVVRESIKEVLVTLVEAIALVILVMFLFLQNWRSTLIPAITIPVSLVGTFAFVKLFGFSINTLTLFGIVLATGIVVDDAIVVIENIERHMREEGKPAFRAAIDAMREVLGAVVVIGIVLVAVFVPVAFFPGTTGRLYQQFSLTIAFAVVLSVFNAVTFTPALSAVLLDKETHAHGRFFTAINRGIDAGTSAYVRLLKRALALRPLMLGLFALGLLATWGLFRIVPSAFVPEEDEGYFISVIQAPAGASLEYTTAVAKQAEAILFKDPDIQAAFSVVGFSFSGAAPNNGLIFTRLKDYHERPGKQHSLQAVLGRVRGPMMAIPGGLVIPFAPPGIQGLSVFGGFQYELLDQTGGDISGLAEAVSTMTAKGNQSGRVVGLFSGFRANDPQLVVDIDRDKARSLNLPLREVTDALQVFLGSAYVNDFDFNNRAYRVYVQADQQYRSDPKDLRQLYARAADGAMVPLDSVVRTRETTAPQVISHFNLFRSAEINGAAAPGVSSGQALEEMGRLSRENLPPGFDYAWAGQSLEEIKAGTQAASIFALSLVLVYLVLAAQYESWVLPFIILLGVPLAVIGGLGAQLARGLANDVFCQVGLVMLIGLAAKNSILIVEFAEQLRERGMGIAEAAVEAARIRLRPILMTSFAFILGVLPLAVATGAGAGARNSVGTSVAGGMLASTFLSIFFIPVLYVVIRGLAPGKARGEARDAVVVEEGAHA
jgi:HAE1 family hydrophobic/amphiphilic exporter-1